MNEYYKEKLHVNHFYEFKGLNEIRWNVHFSLCLTREYKTIWEKNIVVHHKPIRDLFSLTLSYYKDKKWQFFNDMRYQ